jgi:hypothetical protein
MVIGDQADIEELKPLVRNGGYICKGCGRVAKNKENLCAPIEL